MFEKITLYYSKQTGKVKQYTTGEHDMKFYGEDQVDYEIIYDCIVVDYDRFIENNFSQFSVIDGVLEYTPPASLMRFMK